MWNDINPFTLRVPPETIVCYFHTFENNLGMKRKFKKYLKESFCLTSGQHFSIKYFYRNAFHSKSYTKIVRPVSAALSVNGLISISMSNPFMTVADKTAWQFWGYLENIWGKIVQWSLCTNLLQIFCPFMLRSKVIFQWLTGPDDTGQIDP